MLALAFLVLIGVALIANGLEVRMDRALIYGPMAFAIALATLNLTTKRRHEPTARRTITPPSLPQHPGTPHPGS